MLKWIMGDMRCHRMHRNTAHWSYSDPIQREVVISVSVVTSAFLRIDVVGTVIPVIFVHELFAVA